MLIDFSDLLQVSADSHFLGSPLQSVVQVNVFELGHTYLQLVRTLNLRLPLVDPSHYISRFASLLEFGDEIHKVATDAVRLVQRFDRDWMTKGRRPAGICGAALLLAARMNNFRRSVEEIVQVVKIADTTLKRRLDEFKATPSGGLTLADFRSVWLDDEMDPPAFIKGREREEAERRAAEAMASGVSEVSKEKKRKGKRKRGEDSEKETPHFPLAVSMAAQTNRFPIDPTTLQQGIFADAVDPMIDVHPQSDDHQSLRPTLFQHSSSTATISPVDNHALGMPPAGSVEATASNVLAEEVSAFLQNTQGAKLSEALDEAEQRRLAQITVTDDLLGLDEDELDRFILSEEEVRIKERVWVELNRDYLEAIAGQLFYICVLKGRRVLLSGFSQR